MIKWLLVICLFTTPLICGEYPLLKRLEKAKVGDFLVFEANKNITLLAIRSLTDQSLVLEEISAPSSKVKVGNWASWIQAKAPGHTSWSMIEIDLVNQRILECYSFDRTMWIPQSPKDSFLATLLHLKVTQVDTSNRRKIGPPPQEGEADHRKVWNPPLYIDGKRVENISSDAYTASWPKDGSELAGKDVCIYFDHEGKVALPCWIQIDTGQVTGSLRAIDSGHRLPTSAHRTMPRRIPEFIGAATKTKKGLRLSIKSPKYYKQFELFAVDVTTKDKQIHLISHSLAEGQGDVLTLDIDSRELHQILTPNHKYTWLVVPKGYSASYSELPKPFVWQ
jgi:hypothetical protein